MQTNDKLIYSSKLDVFSKEYLKKASILVGGGIFSVVLVILFFPKKNEDILSSILIAFFIVALMLMSYRNQQLVYLRSFEIDTENKRLRVKLLYVIWPYRIHIPFDKLQIKLTELKAGEELTGYDMVLRKEMDEKLTLSVFFTEFESSEFSKFLHDLQKEVPHLNGIVYKNTL